MTPIEAYIFSCNRGMQLDFLLRSIRDNFNNINKIHIFYEYDKEFLNGLEKVQSKKYGIPIKYYKKTKETFENIFKHTINTIKTKYITGFCDDDFVVRSDSIEIMLNNYSGQVVSISLRKSKNSTVEYHDSISPKQPIFEKTKPYLLWNWKQISQKNNWYFACVVGGCVYKTEIFKEFLNQTSSFSSPSSLEGRMYHASCFQKYPLAIAPLRTKVLNISVNRVQNEVQNRFSSEYYQSIKFLNDKFMDGFIISSKNLYNYNNNCAFIEVPFEFIKG